jgi:hypothetical protein
MRDELEREFEILELLLGKADSLLLILGSILTDNATLNRTNKHTTFFRSIMGITFSYSYSEYNINK